MSTAETDARSKVGVSTFVRGLEERGWTLGGNVQIEYRWAAANANLYRRFAQELVALAPDVIVAVGGTGVSALQQESRTIPIVFVGTNNPIERGLIASIERPGGNTTGFIDFEFSIGRKWLELLKQVAPTVSRVAVIRNPVQFSGIGLAAVEKAAPSFNVAVGPIDARSAIEMEQRITAFARDTNGGLIVTPSPFSVLFRDQIITLADRHKLPTVYFNRYFVTGGGLISYGPDLLEQASRAAGYVDRILKGEKPADMPVQAPTKYELVVNLKAAKALGLTIPAGVLSIADEVIK
jgi:putative ABC transport system substrate-binding protein